MNIKQVMAACLVAASATAVSAQTQDLFRVAFKANCVATGANGLSRNSKITDKDIIARCISSNGVSSRALVRNYALVYNTSADSLQVVSAANGTLVCDVVQFQPVAFTSDPRQTDQFAFMFLPDQTTAFGSAVISQRNRNLTGSANDRANITGKLQFVLTGDMALGGTNGPAATTGEAATTNGLIAQIEAATGLNISGTNGATPTGTNAAVTTGTNVVSVPGTNVGSILGTNLTVIGTNILGSGGTNITTIPATNALSAPSNPVFSIGTPAINVPVTNTFAEIYAGVATNTVTGNETNLVSTNVLAGIDTNAFAAVSALAATNLTNLVNVRICTGTFTAGRRVVVTGTP
jgi:hypothetical protein